MDLVKNNEEKKLNFVHTQPGIICKIDNRTTDDDIIMLLEKGVRTFLIQLSRLTPCERECIILKLNTIIDKFKTSTQFDIPVSIAAEIKGQNVQTGRLRNNKPIKICIGDLITLTVQKEYEFVSIKEVIYVSNMKQYLSYLKPEDIIFMDNANIKLKIVKITNGNVNCCIRKGSILKSYMDIELPYCIMDYVEANDEDIVDIKFISENNIDFVAIPGITNFDYLKNILDLLKPYDHIIGAFPSLHCHLLDSVTMIEEIIKIVPAIWITDLFQRNDKNIQTEIYENLIEIVSKSQIALIVNIPIKSRKDFDRLKNLTVFDHIDTVCIEKSEKTNTFPIIVNKLFYKSKYDKKFDNSNLNDKKVGELTSREAVIDTIKYTTEIKTSYAVLISSKIDIDAIIAVSKKRIYNPIIAIINTEAKGKVLNFFKDVKPLIYDNIDDEDCCFQYGIKYGCSLKLLNLGDFIITYFETLYHDNVVSKFKTMYVPKFNIT